MYIYLSNTDSLNIYPTNTPGKFYSKLPNTLYLDGQWDCALLQFQYVNKYFHSVPSNLFVCMDLCLESIADNRKIPILRRISNVKNIQIDQTIESTFDQLVYVPLKQKVIDVIEIYIVDEKSNPIIFSQGPLLTTLHFRKRK